MELSGGSWGPGRLCRDSDEPGAGQWWWEPASHPGTTLSASSRNWTRLPDPPQLRARVLAVLPWADRDDLASPAPDSEDSFRTWGPAHYRRSWSPWLVAAVGAWAFPNGSLALTRTPVTVSATRPRSTPLMVDQRYRPKS